MQYVLSRRDTPLSLSARYGLPLCMLYRSNQKAKWRPGERIDLPLGCLMKTYVRETPVFHLVPHRVMQGETVYMLAARYHTVMHRILQQNGLSHPEQVKTGQMLQIPCLNDEFMVYSYQVTDTPAQVAARFAMTEQELLRINDNSGWYSGMRIIVRRREKI